MKRFVCRWFGHPGWKAHKGVWLCVRCGAVSYVRRGHA